MEKKSNQDVLCEKKKSVFNKKENSKINKYENVSVNGVSKIQEKSLYKYFVTSFHLMFTILELSLYFFLIHWWIIKPRSAQCHVVDINAIIREVWKSICLSLFWVFTENKLTFPAVYDLTRPFKFYIEKHYWRAF